MSDLETKPSGGNPYNNGMPSPHLRKIADPAPLGLFSFASTTLVLSFVNVHARGVTEPNIVIGLAVVCGGLAQLLAGMWEFARGNTFGATAFSSYGAFWMSYALILIPGSGVLAAYAEAPQDLGNALGFYLTAWFIFTFCIFLASWRTSAALVALFFFLDMTYLFLMIGAYTGKLRYTKVGGGFGLLTAAISYYAAASGLMTPEGAYFPLPAGDLPKYA